MAVRLSELARTDLLEIWCYIAPDNEPAADRLYERILTLGERMLSFPEMGRERPDLGPGLRSFPVGNYIVFYRLVSDGIEIARVLHGHRDIEASFFPDVP